jgi:hypothetical protein
MSYHPSDIVSPRVNASCCLPRVVGRLINPTIGLWQCTSCVLEGCSLDFWGQDAVQILSCQAGWGQATVGVLQVLVCLWTCPGAVNAHWVDLVVRQRVSCMQLVYLHVHNMRLSVSCKLEIQLSSAL